VNQRSQEIFLELSQNSYANLTDHNSRTFVHDSIGGVKCELSKNVVML